MIPLVHEGSYARFKNVNRLYFPRHQGVLFSVSFPCFLVLIFSELPLKAGDISSNGVGEGQGLVLLFIYSFT